MVIDNGDGCAPAAGEIRRQVAAGVTVKIEKQRFAERSLIEFAFGNGVM